MTSSIQSSVLKSGYSYNKRRAASKYYTVVVNTEDDSKEFEVEAATFAEASAKAQGIASRMTDVTYVEIYSI